MKTIVPFCSVDELKLLIDTKVDEFYCGVLLPEWTQKYSLSFSANKRAKKANSLQSFDELKQAYDLIKSKGKNMYFIFNNFYVASQRDLVDLMFDSAKGIGIENYTVTDFYMIDKVKKAGLNPILSCTTPVLNKEAAALFKELGVKKIILPRDLDIDEIDEITSNVDLDYEVIVKNESCPNIDGLCRFFHGQKKNGDFVTHACCVNFDTKIKSSFSAVRKEDIVNRVKGNKERSMYSNYCGVCYVSKLSKVGINYLKIPSRGHEIESKIRDIDFVHFGIDRINFSEIKKEVMAEYVKVYGHMCGEKCYYS